MVTRSSFWPIFPLKCMFTALIRNRVSRRVSTLQHHVWVSLSFQETRPTAPVLGVASCHPLYGAPYMAGPQLSSVVPSGLAMPMSTPQRPGVRYVCHHNHCYDGTELRHYQPKNNVQIVQIAN